MNAVNIVTALGLWAVAPDQWKVPALALGYALSYAVTVPVAWRLLRRRTGPLPTYDVVRTIVRVGLASLIAGLGVLAVSGLLTEWWGRGRGASLVIVLLAGAVGGALYLAVARRLRVGEVAEVLDLVGSRLRPRRSSS
jgi:putative peptidoglycan lipid II flippase